MSEKIVIDHPVIREISELVKLCCFEAGYTDDKLDIETFNYFMNDICTNYFLYGGLDSSEFVINSQYVAADYPIRFAYLFKQLSEIISSSFIHRSIKDIYFLGATGCLCIEYTLINPN